MKRLYQLSLVIGTLMAFVIAMPLLPGVREPRAPSRALTPLEPLDQNGIGIQVRGNVAYEMLVGLGIIIYDISNPLKPQQLAVIPRPEEGVWLEFDVVGDYLYAFEMYSDWERRGRVHIFDVSNPTTPVELAQFVGPGYEGFGFPYNIKASEDNRYLHLSESSAWPEIPIQVYDILDLSSPKLIATYAGECGANDFRLVGNRAYVKLAPCEDGSSQAYSMAIYDISDAASPVLMSDGKLQELTRGLDHFSVWEDRLYISVYERINTDEILCEIRVISVADPTNPSLMGVLDDCGGAIAVEDGLLYMATNDIHWEELRAYSVVDPKNISLISRYQLPRFSSFFVPFDVQDNCVFWVVHYRTIGLYTMCTAGVAASTATPTPTATPDIKQYMPIIYTDFDS